jgi:drug/metabolite transporter (DMT)-like permease
MQAARTTLTAAGAAITLAGAILFSTKAILVKLAFAGVRVDAVTLLSLRMLFSLPFYLLAAYWVGQREGNVPMSRRQWLLTVSLGIMGYYLSSLFDFLGLQYISAGLERLILFLYPTFALLINRGFLKQRITGVQALALLFTYSGIALAFAGEWKGVAGDPLFLKGCGLVLLCALTYSAYIVGSGWIIPQVGATKFTAWAMLSSTAGVFLHYLLSPTDPLSALPGEAWIYGVLLAVVATVTPSFLLSNGMKKIGANNVAILSSIGPVSTILQAYFFLGEPLHGGQLGGTALVVAGIVLLGWKRGG